MAIVLEDARRNNSKFRNFVSTVFDANGNALSAARGLEQEVDYEPLTRLYSSQGFRTLWGEYDYSSQFFASILVTFRPELSVASSDGRCARLLCVRCM
jgi:hypothetical protein